MLVSDLSLRQVEAFRALMQWRTVTRAAQVLGISQPAVSRLLADFEAKVGFALFERRQGRLLPTVEAHTLQDEVERAFFGFERVAQAAAQIRAQRRGVVRVAASADLCADFLPRVAAAFASEHEGVDFELLTGEAAGIAERVAAQRCDLGFAAQAVAHPGARLEYLGEWPLRCIVPRGHRLARKRVIHAQDCGGERFISFAAASEARLSIDRHFAECGVAREPGVEAALAQSVVAMVEAGMGIALVDALTAQHASARVSVKRFTPALSSALHVVRSTQRAATALSDAFVWHATAALARLR
ncbi:LysR substrate-binding domain-containing protein [Paraburkholderia silvatlantica]|uniref:DNA-binding transcriptional LysR family regulator n=1 Tax=Paraburkholderia silvatlantica TaxID=321895 RepID=A0A2U1ABB2_9BURK|nr:LysR substrate-binding domain-containing protein [Paraburkholderia silvatlantica]MBB2930232.1 DNA-binding transcriptional LysR family regulator [Paraburkholderia silvatlantica]PVY32061.1 LysR family transcriptional regulator [Paraburkholderia silvatlantica]PXW37681.1 LysR family transcriptional regulator [Paraburkholderia silvatlantica]PYE25502.1 LysR family transcriptional regulator [Paraburkholderia silvatlantica]TDQ97855.1 LysR family transcriptional regulator [Paraburkholderia silvatlan